MFLEIQKPLGQYLKEWTKAEETFQLDMRVPKYFDLHLMVVFGKTFLSQCCFYTGKYNCSF